MNQLKNVKKFILIPIICFVISFGPYIFSSSRPMTRVYAGDINGAEARIIAVASGTFTYDGKTYKAYSSYVSQLYSYLAQDDVDLSEDQASRVISYIYSNVLTGIDSGYVYEVKEPEANNTDLNEVEEQQEEEERQEQKATKEASDKEVEKMFEDIEEDTKNRVKTKPKASETDATVIMTDDAIVITDEDNEQTVITSDDRIIPQWFVYILPIIGVVALVINLFIFVFLILKGCMRFKGNDRQKPKKGHRKRRRIRKVCRRTLMFTTAVGVTALFFGITLSIGLFNNNKIIQNIQGSGYFRYAYTEYLAEATAQEKAETTAEETNKKLNYEDFLITEKHALDELKASDLTNGRSLAPYIGRMQEDMKQSLIISAVLLITATLIAVVACIFMDLRRERGIRSLAIGVLIGTVITVVLGVILKLLHMEDRFFIEPDYLYDFIRTHLEWCNKVYLITGLFGAVISLSLVGVYRSKRKNRD